MKIFLKFTQLRELVEEGPLWEKPWKTCVRWTAIYSVKKTCGSEFEGFVEGGMECPLTAIVSSTCNFSITIVAVKFIYIY